MYSLVLLIALALNAASILMLAYGSFRILWAAWLLRDLRYSLAGASILLLTLGLVGESFALYSVVLTGAGYGRWMALPRPYWAGTLSTPFVFLYPIGYALLLCSAYVGAEKESRSWGLGVVPLGWLISQWVSVFLLVGLLMRSLRSESSDAAKLSYAFLMISHLMITLPSPRIMMYSSLIRTLGFLLFVTSFRGRRDAG